MDFFKTMERINVLHKLIKERKTGNPELLSKRIGVSRATLYNIIDELKSYNAPIAYSRAIESFFYTKPYELNLYCKIELIDDEVELKKVVGGCEIISSVYFFRRKEDNFVNISHKNLTC